MLPTLLLACVLHSSPPPTTPAEVNPVSFGPLEEKVNLLLGETSDEDQRTRLEQARELMFSMRAKDPAAQKLVYDYLSRVIAVEERVRPQLVAEMAFEDGVQDVQEIAIDEGSVTETPVDGPVTPPPPLVPVDSSPPPETPVAPPVAPSVAPPEAVTVSPDLEKARTLLAQGHYAEAADMLVSATDEASRSIRKEAVDGWARTERERAGQLFIEARKLPPGAERDAAVRKVKETLAGVNVRYPDNAYAAQIAQHIARVDTELGSKP